MLRSYKSYIRNKATTGESTKYFQYYEEMSIELANRPDIAPQVLKGSNVKKEDPEKESSSVSKPEAVETPTKRRKLERADKLEKLIDATSDLKPILLENQRIEQERNDMFKDFLSFLKNKN